VHPGEVLLEEFMKPKGLTSSALAAKIGVPVNRVSQIIAGKRAVTADTAWKLSKEFGSAEFWMNLQSAYDLTIAGAPR
jgi:antitoxin HigA-1